MKEGLGKATLKRTVDTVFSILYLLSKIMPASADTKMLPENAERLKNLRVVLQIPGTHFAALLGMSVPKLVNRERGASPWKPEEIAKAKEKVAELLKAGTTALDLLDAQSL